MVFINGKLKSHSSHRGSDKTHYWPAMHPQLWSKSDNYTATMTVSEINISYTNFTV